MTNNLEFHSVTLTPDVVGCLHNVLALYRASLQDQPESPERWAREQEATRLYRWLTYTRQSLYRCWQELPEGDHLKEAYRDEVWSWNDEDLAAAAAARDANNLPGSDVVDLQGLCRPKPEELADG